MDMEFAIAPGLSGPPTSLSTLGSHETGPGDLAAFHKPILMSIIAQRWLLTVNYGHASLVANPL